MTVKLQGLLERQIQRLIGNTRDFVGAVGEDVDARLRERLRVPPEQRPPTGGARFAGPGITPTGFSFLSEQQARGVATFVRRTVITRAQRDVSPIPSDTPAEIIFVRPTHTSESKFGPAMRFQWPEAPPEVRDTFEKKGTWPFVFFKLVKVNVAKLRERVTTTEIRGEDVREVLQSVDLVSAFRRISQ